MSPQIITKVSDIVQWRRGRLTEKISVVPTMGALHEGHATLLKKQRPCCDLSVLTIFVNPTQFGPQEDLSKYPRTFESDLRIAEREGVDLVFAPLPEEIYPHGYSTFVEESTLSVPLCGRFRPGHFRGVTTVVLKLFNLLRPHVAYFGLKDAQQFFVLEKMVRDLNLDIRLEGVPTVRESDGLALSSRNVYLSAEHREIAPYLYRVLVETKEALVSGRAPNEILGNSKMLLENRGFQVQYLDCLSLPEFQVLGRGDTLRSESSYLLAAAAFLGKTRLIDNLIFSA